MKDCKMSAFLCDAETVGFVSNISGIPAIDIARLNIRSVAYRYEMTPKQVVKEFLGYTHQKDYLKDCQTEQSNPSLFPTYAREDLYQDKLGEVIYQCCEIPDTETDKTYQELLKERVR
jgi:hypothetical protein